MAHMSLNLNSYQGLFRVEDLEFRVSTPESGLYRGSYKGLL